MNAAVEPLPGDDAPCADKAALARIGAEVRERLAGDPAIYKFPTEQAELFAVGDFLTPAECARVCEMIDAVAKPSHVYDGDYGKYRTSYSGDIDAHDHFVKMIERRLCDLTGIDPAFGEAVQGQRYHPGQEFREHHDWFDTTAFYWPDEKRRGGQRSWTAMVYLNDCEAGGATDFTRLDISVSPTRGALLLWNNARPDGRPNPYTVHAARPVEAGEKYVITKWFRTRRWR